MNGPALLKEKDKKDKGHPKRWWQKRCDKQMQLKGKEMFPKSLVSSKPTEVMHHFIPKSVCARLRYDWDNLIPLTNAEHCRLHQSPDPDIEMQIVKKKWEGWYESLQKKRQEPHKETIEYYKYIWEMLQ